MKYISDFSCNELKAAALATTNIVARRPMYLRDWQAQGACKSAVVKLPFDVSSLFMDQQ